MQEMQETWLNPWVEKTPKRRAWHPTPVFLPGKSHGQRNLVGYSPWGHEESDTTSIWHAGIEPESPALQADCLPSEPPGKPCCWPTIRCFLYYFIFFLLFLFSAWECPDSHNLPYLYCFKVHYLFFLAVIILLFIFMTLTIRSFSVVIKWYLLMFQTFCTWRKVFHFLSF